MTMPQNNIAMIPVIVNRTTKINATTQLQTALQKMSLAGLICLPQLLIHASVTEQKNVYKTQSVQLLLVYFSIGKTHSDEIHSVAILPDGQFH